jgi:hypothetical protein
VDRKNCEFLGSKGIKVKPSTLSAVDYFTFLRQVRGSLPQTFPAISHEAELFSRKVQDPVAGMLLSTLRKRYPGWTGFDDERLIKEELDYKRAASAHAMELLNRSEFQRLLESAQFDKVIARLEKIGKGKYFLFLAVPKTGDLGVLYQEHLDRASFCRMIFELLHGETDIADRMATYFNYVQENKLPNKWPFVTLLLFLLHPESEIFIKS